jgi:hypothetical protein
MVKDRLARATIWNAAPTYLSLLFCSAPDLNSLHSPGFRHSIRPPGLISSTILPVSYAAAPLAAYPHNSVIA